MNQFTHVARRLVAGAVVALAMTVGLTSLTVAGSSAAEETVAWPATLSRLDRLMIEPRRTSKKAKARPVRPMRIRCALLPAS